MAIKGEKKDETRGKEVRDRRGRKKEKRGENESAETKKQWEESVKKREAEGGSWKRESKEMAKPTEENETAKSENATPTEELSHHLLFSLPERRKYQRKPPSPPASLSSEPGNQQRRPASP